MHAVPAQSLTNEGCSSVISAASDAATNAISAFAVSMCGERIVEKQPEPRLVPVLAGLLDPRQPDLRWHAVEALRKINTAEAAEALQPHLGKEQDLYRKLQLAEFLGRHRLRDGYSYALEHMSEPALREQAVAALGAIREPSAVEALRKILKTSNDTNWNAAAIRALGRLGDTELTPQYLQIVQDLKDPLAPAALIALGDLGEANALANVRAAFESRNDDVVTAGVRAAGKLLALPAVKADDLRDRLAAILADANAPQESRAAALDASELLRQVEKLMSERKLQFTVR